MRRLAGAAVAAVMVAACGGETPGTGPSQSGSGPLPAGSAPAGVQFSNLGTLPAGFELQSSPVVHGSSMLVAGNTGHTGTGGARPVVALSANSGKTWTVVHLPAGVSAPAGFPINRSGYIARQAAAGDPGFVVTGDASWWNGNFLAASLADFVWFSPNGHTWRAVDLRSVVGQGSLAIQVRGVNWVNGRFVITGAVAPLDISSGPSRGLVLTSTDGVIWKQAASPPATWSLELGGAMQFGKRLLVWGTEYVCTANAGAFTTFSTGGQPRLWASDNNGGSWTAVKLPSDVLGGAKPVPKNNAACHAAGGGTLGGNANSFGQSLAGLAVAGTSVVAWSNDHRLTAITSDLTSWASATVPGAAAVDAKTNPHPPLAALVTEQNGTPLLISLEARRTADDRSGPPGDQTLVWMLSGGAWQRQPVGRPLSPRTGVALLAVGEKVWLVDALYDAEKGLAIEIEASEAGPLLPWGTCTPAVHADCAYATITSASLHGADLSGINLNGATVRDSDLSGANLSGASMRDAVVSSVKFTGASLKKVVAIAARITTSDMSGTDLSDADFTDAGIPPSLFSARTLKGVVLIRAALQITPGDTLAHASFAGLNLNGMFFSSSQIILPMTGANFRGANVSETLFSGVDLTGASFAGAVTDNIYFGGKVTCPDGKPPATGVFGRAACRI